MRILLAYSQLQEAKKKGNDPLLLAGMYKKAAEDALREGLAALSLRRNEYAFGGLSELVDTDTISRLLAQAEAFAEVGSLTRDEAVKIVKKLSKGESKIGRKSILEVATLIAAGKDTQALRRFDSLDIFHREVFPDNILYWMWFYNDDASYKQPASLDF